MLFLFIFFQRPASLLFISKISGFCLDEFLELHVAACTDEKSPFQAFSCLIDKENDEYLLRLDEKVDLCKILPEKEWKRAEAEQMVGFLTKRLQKNPEKILEVRRIDILVFLQKNKNLGYFTKN